MKLLAAALCIAATCAVLFSALTAHASSKRAVEAPGPLELCVTGAVELVEERCAKLGGCASQSVRLTWDRGEGTLFLDEREHRRIPPRDPAPLLKKLAALTPRSTDSDLVCGTFGCPPTDRALTITTECGPNESRTFTFMRGHGAWDRVRSECARVEGAQLARCTAERAWHAAFATALATRFDTVFEHLKENTRSCVLSIPAVRRREVA